MGTTHRALCLGVAKNDRTFARKLWQGRVVWQGKCIHCRSHILLAEDGMLLGSTTLEHILPQSHGGTDAPDNLALACRRCNNTQGARLDILPVGHPRLMAVVERLSQERRRRLKG